MGHGEQGNRRREEAGIRPGQENQPELFPKGRKDRRTSFSIPIQIVSFGLGEEGRRYPATESGWRDQRDPEPQQVELEPKSLQRPQQQGQQPEEGQNPLA